MALAEANDPIECSDHALDEPAPLGASEAVPSIMVTKIDDAAPDEGLLSKVGRGRIASFGCPHCGRDDVSPWGKAGGKPRYRCANCRKTNKNPRSKLRGIGGRKEAGQKNAASCGEYVPKVIQNRHCEL